MQLVGKKTFFRGDVWSDGIVLEMLQNDSPGTGDEVKKIPSKNIFSSWRKMIYKIFIFIFFDFSIENSIFLKYIFYLKNRVFY